MTPLRMPAGMRRAFSTLGCPELPLEDALGLAARHGVDAVELRTLEGTTDLPALFARSGPEDLRRTLGAHRRVLVLVLATSFRLVRPGAEDRAALLAFAPWAEALGVPWLRVFDGGDPSDPGAVSLAAETLRWWRGLRRERGWNVDVIVETHDSLLSGERIRQFGAEAGGARLLWDTHHTWRASGVPPHELWPEIAAQVAHIHVKDSVSRPSGRFPYTYVLPGQGEFPMGPLRAALQRDGYAHAVSLEWERQWHPELPPLEDALRAAAARGWW